MIELSIVIATYNRAQPLLRTLGSLARQTLDPALWEVVVVDNNCADDTAARFARWAEAHPKVNARLTREPQQGLSPARNRGVAESAGAYIAIIDDDEEVNPEFAESYFRFFRDYPGAAAAGGRIVPLYEYAPPAWLSPYTERPIAGTLDLGPEARPFPAWKFPGGGNMAVRRSALVRYGAFDPALGRTGANPLAGEEKELFGRLRAGGEQVWYVPGAVIYHIIPESKFDPAYFDRLTRQSGVSERIRTQGISRAAYLARLLAEAVKWGGTLALAAGYALRGEAIKGRYLIRMRRNVTCGLLRG